MSRIIELKDSTLEEINKLFQEQNQHNKDSLTHIRTLSMLLDQHNIEDYGKNRVEEMVEHLRETIGQIDFRHWEFYESKMMDITFRHNDQMKNLTQP